MDRFDEAFNMVLKEIHSVFDCIDNRDVERLIDDILNADKVFFVGVGRVLLSCQAWTKRLNQIGVVAHCVGDITEPALTQDDILIVVSGSGESIVPVAIAKKAKQIGARRIVHIGSNVNSSVKNYTDYQVRIPTRTKLYLAEEIDSQQIMTSLFEQVILILGDVICQMIVEKSSVDLKQLWRMHANLE